ncbi:hypothetical protein [Staphylococcus simulans]|uniref:hypothetical protein n=1 Tax=Staphylococcus simulans TaxID=1286 RepID=UPI000E6A1E38|nr:hypothetical protein [Staphylococcus simulans]RIN44326.1 hypothetical protein BU049_11375 [Staphylococcus simulans]RIN70961.1 hypothetical protein BU017_07910 [Staphylococcus simulans]
MTKLKVVKTNLLHEGTVYPVGSSIELNDEQAAKLQHYLERQHEPDNKAYQDQADTTHEDYEDMTISELKKLVEKKNIEVIPSGTNGRTIKADYIKALKQ